MHSEEPIALALMGAVVLLGYYAGHGARLIKLPGLIGYMVLGVAFGPSLFGFFGEERLHALTFITHVALGFVAFSIGCELDMGDMKRLGRGIVAIILSESFFAFGVVLTAVYLLTRDLPLSLVFASVAPASAPAGTVAVIQEYKAKGNLTKALYAVVGFDDGLAIFIFGFAAALAKSLLVAEHTGVAVSILPAMAAPAQEIVFSVVVGAVLGFVLGFLLRTVRNPRDYFILVFGVVLLGTGVSVQYHLSLILTNMVVGFVLVNTRRAALVHSVGEQLRGVMPLLFILFFALAGAHLKLGELASLGVLGGVYILGRTAGLILGAFVGGTVGRVEPRIRNWIGFGILSQAGVAIGLSLIIRHEFGLIGSPHADAISTSVITTITATCIFFEIIGPIGTKIALQKAGEIGAEDGSGPSPA